MTRVAAVLVFSCSFMLTMGNMGLVSVLPAIGRSIGIPDIFVAATFSFSGLMLAIFSPVWARISDRRGRKPLMVTGMSAYAVAMTLSGVAIMLGLLKLTPWWAVVIGLFGSRALFGMIGSAIGPASQAYVAERVPRDERTKALSTLAGGQGLGMIIGPLLAPVFILPFVGLSGPLFGFAALAAILTLLILVFLSEGAPLPEEDGPARLADSRAQGAGAVKPPPLWRDPRVTPFMLFALAISIAQSVQVQIVAFLIIDTLHISPAEAQGRITFALMAGAIAGLAAQWVFIRIFRMKPRDLMQWGAGFALLGHILTVASQNYWFIFAGYAVASFGFGFARPGFTAGLSISVTNKEQAGVAGLLAAMAGLNVLTPLFLLLYHIHMNAPFWVNIAFLVLAFFYSFRNDRLRTSGT